MEKRRGRTKTKEYSTLMARIPQDLVDRVKAFASQHQQPISVLIRDALEHYMNADDILSYRYRNMSDMNGKVSDTSEESVQPALVSVAPQDLQAMVDAAVQRALVTMHGAVTRDPAIPAPVPEHVQHNHSGVQHSAPRKRGRPDTMRQRILTLLADHAEGLSAEQIRAYLSPEKPLGDTLQGMRRSGVVRTQGSGNTMQYFVA